MQKLLVLTLTISLWACKPEKLVERREEELVMQAITTGQWKVTSFIHGSNDVTADFYPYRFQFKNNYTVNAIKYGVVEKTGTWSADVDAMTMTSGFGNAGVPLIYLNGTFDIDSTTWTSVNASQIVNGEYRTLRLDKD